MLHFGVALGFKFLNTSQLVLLAERKGFEPSIQLPIY